MSKRRHTFAGGAALLGIVGLSCSALGSLYRIVLAHVIGDAGIAYYQIAYPIYSVLTVVATVGIPAAISRQVSMHIAREDYKNARAFFKTALIALGIGGFLAGGALAALSGVVAAAQGVPDAGTLILAVAPALWLACLISAFRGYFQGLQQMQPTAVSLIIEEVVKSVFGFIFMLLYLQSGSRMAALGALLGIPMAEVAATIYLGIRYAYTRDRWIRLMRQTPTGYKLISVRNRLRALIKLAIPITLSASVLPLIALTDNLMIINILKANGFSQAVAQMRFGLLTGLVAPVVYVPMALANALQMSLVPAVSASASLGRYHEVEQQARIGIKLAFLVALPCMVAFYLLGPPLLQVLFSSTMAQESTMLVARTLIRTLSVALCFLIVVQTTNGILQGVGEIHIPLMHLWQGAAIKVVVSYFLMRMPSVHINGAAIGTASCFMYIALMNLKSVRNILHRPIGLARRLIAPALASIVMGLVSYGCYRLCLLALPIWIGVIVAIVLAIVVYLFIILRLRVINSADCRLLPYGLKLDSWMHRIGWWQ